MDCPHWWVIESPNGKEYLTGTCRLCGTVRHDFKASLEDEYLVLYRDYDVLPKGQRSYSGLAGNWTVLSLVDALRWLDQTSR